MMMMMMMMMMMFTFNKSYQGVPTINAYVAELINNLSFLILCNEVPLTPQKSWIKRKKDSKQIQNMSQTRQERKSWKIFLHKINKTSPAIGCFIIRRGKIYPVRFHSQHRSLVLVVTLRVHCKIRYRKISNY